MSIAKARLALGLMGLLAVGPGQERHAQQSSRVTGTYTNMYYNREGGDVLGEELKIVLTQGEQYEGALQFAEGEPEHLIVVGIEFTGNRISFSIPDADAHAGRFSGILDNGAIRGQFKFNRGGVEDVVLKKGKSYWD
jgi:hypothetical protein